MVRSVLWQDDDLELAVVSSLLFGSDLHESLKAFKSVSQLVFVCLCFKSNPLALL